MGLRLDSIVLVFTAAAGLGRSNAKHAPHMVEAVVPFVDGRYRTVTSAEGRLVLGFSKAGWAAPQIRGVGSSEHRK